MSTVFIFLFGFVVSVMVAIALVLIGLAEAADPALSRPEDLANWERELVKDQRDDLGPNPKR